MTRVSVREQNDLNRQLIRANRNGAVIVSLNKFFLYVQNGGNLGSALRGKGYNKIAIYGMGYVGARLYQELLKYDMIVPYVIDANGGNVLGNLEVIHPCNLSSMENVDLIIVTPTYDFEDIKNNLQEYTDMEIRSIDELLEDLLK